MVIKKYIFVIVAILALASFSLADTNFFSNANHNNYSIYNISEINTLRISIIGDNAPSLKTYLTNSTSYTGISASNSMIQDVGFAILSYGSNRTGSAFGVPKVNLTRFYTYGSQFVIGTWQEYNITIGTNDTAAIIVDTTQKTHFQDEVIMGGNNITGINCITFESGGQICSGS